MAAADLTAAKQCIRELEQVTLELGPRWRVKPFGGIANGFATRGSDLDVTCYIEGMEASYRPFATQELQMQLLPLLRGHPRFEVMDQIWTARVPILKLRFDRQLDVDLSCHNTEALPNTQLLRAYAELSPQVRELGLMIKLWAKEEGVCGAPRGYLSSYSLTLMAIYYMQVDPHVRMPCLPTAHYSGNDAASPKERMVWACPFPTQVLLARFFRFYASEFQWCTEVVSVRQGTRALAEDPMYSQLGAICSWRLHIEDPILTGRNLHCVLGPQQEFDFYTKICNAADSIQSGLLPDRLGCPLRPLGAPAAGPGPVGLLLGAAAARAAEGGRSGESSVQASSSDSGTDGQTGVHGGWGSPALRPDDGSCGSCEDEAPITLL